MAQFHVIRVPLSRFFQNLQHANVNAVRNKIHSSCSRVPLQNRTIPNRKVANRVRWKPTRNLCERWNRSMGTQICMSLVTSFGVNSVAFPGGQLWSYVELFVTRRSFFSSFWFFSVSVRCRRRDSHQSSEYVRIPNDRIDYRTRLSLLDSNNKPKRQFFVYFYGKYLEYSWISTRWLLKYAGLSSFIQNAEAAVQQVISLSPVASFHSRIDLFYRHQLSLNSKN